MLRTDDDWIRHLTALAGPGTARGGPASALAVHPLDGPPPTVLRAGDPDATLWRAACAGAGDESLGAADTLLAARPGDSLAASGGYAALEVWTECELGALHALARLVRRHPSPARAARMDALVEWHLEHTQPDNATNRPWALHAFVRAGAPEARLYAETLLHNATASDARHEPLTRWILLDAARELSALRDAPGAP
jgi:hypothetical protein